MTETNTMSNLFRDFWNSRQDLTPGEHNHTTVWCEKALLPHMCQVAFKGKGFRLLDPNAWVQTGKQIVNVSLPDDPSWNELWKACDSAIEQSGDVHHVFIESFEIDYDAKTVTVFMGS